MRKITEITIVNGMKSKFQEDCNRLIKEGFQPYGSLQLGNDQECPDRHRVI